MRGYYHSFESQRANSGQTKRELTKMMARLRVASFVSLSSHLLARGTLARSLIFFQRELEEQE